MKLSVWCLLGGSQEPPYVCENPSSRQKMLKAEAPRFVEFYKAMGLTKEQLNKIMESKNG